ncbi:MAG: hypothetical protein JNM52_00195 [Betaproteobacteria bacterium]|nr:hypothetical protein [Betaproteobacteria bacterium]
MSYLLALITDSYTREDLRRDYYATDAWYRERIDLVDNLVLKIPLSIPLRRPIIRALTRYRNRLEELHRGLFMTFLHEYWRLPR